MSFIVLATNDDRRLPTQLARCKWWGRFPSRVPGKLATNSFAFIYTQPFDQAAIHDSIRKNEIIMPQEHVGQAGFDYAWKGLIQRSKAAGMSLVKL